MPMKSPKVDVAGRVFLTLHGHKLYHLERTLCIPAKGTASIEGFFSSDLPLRMQQLLENECLEAVGQVGRDKHF